jgi:hypothetical protein
MIEDQLLGKLKEAQASFALDALRRPGTRDSFEYGYRVGTVAGYEAAITLLLNLFKDERDGERDL